MHRSTASGPDAAGRAIRVGQLLVHVVPSLAGSAYWVAGPFILVADAGSADLTAAMAEIAAAAAIRARSSPS